MKYIIFLLLLLIPVTSFASHSPRNQTSQMGGDPVESFPVPVLFAVNPANVVPDFGDPRGGGTRIHEGQDFRAPKGTPIVSPTKAIVRSVGTGPSAGKFVYTSNPGGESFRYMHLNEIADISVGDRLDVGDYIGTVGDTGNAPDGVYHLHFETIDADRKPIDPYLRLAGTFTIEEQIESLDDVFDKRRDDASYATFLVETFPGIFTQAVQEGIDLPRAIENALEDTNIVSSAEAVADLTRLIESIPSLLPVELEINDTGALVTLLQIYLIYSIEGYERDQLAAAGPTGYYGGITASAVRALQAEEKLSQTGVYDAKTQQVFAARKLDRLNLGN